MEDSNVIIFMDKVKKLLEIGNKPQAIIEIDSLMTLLERAVLKNKGKRFIPITIPQATETEKANPIFIRDFELAYKFNQVILFLNERFPIQ